MLQNSSIGSRLQETESTNVSSTKRALVNVILRNGLIFQTTREEIDSLDTRKDWED